LGRGGGVLASVQQRWIVRVCGYCGAICFVFLWVGECDALEFWGSGDCAWCFKPLCLLTDDLVTRELVGVWRGVAPCPVKEWRAQESRGIWGHAIFLG